MVDIEKPRAASKNREEGLKESFNERKEPYGIECDGRWTARAWKEWKARVYECATRMRRGLEGEGNSEKRGKPVEISRKGEGRQIGARGKLRFVSPYGRWIWRRRREKESRINSWESSFFFERKNIRIFRTEFDCTLVWTKDFFFLHK